jgi:hypothetical protein
MIRYILFMSGSSIQNAKVQRTHEETLFIPVRITPFQSWFRITIIFQDSVQSGVSVAFTSDIHTVTMLLDIYEISHRVLSLA